jgi:hypothetical protein
LLLKFKVRRYNLVMGGGGEHANAAGARGAPQVMSSSGGGGVAGFSLDASAAVSHLQVRQCMLTGLKPALKGLNPVFKGLNPCGKA